MSHWKNKLDFSKFYHADITINEKASLISEKISSAFPDFADDPDLDEIRYNFDFLGRNPTTDDSGDTEDFNDFMAQLYDWADEEVAPYGEWPANKMCWIETGGMI